MLLRILVATLCTAAVLGERKRDWKRKLKTHRLKRRQRVSRLRRQTENGQTVGITGMVKAVYDSSASSNGFMLYVRTVQGDTSSVELHSGATVGDLYSASAVAMGSMLSFKGELLADPSALLADVGVSTESVVDLSKIAWNDDNLDRFKPIFEAEILVDVRGRQIREQVFLQWNSESRGAAWRDLVGYHAPLAVVKQTSGGNWVQWQDPMELPQMFDEVVTTVTQLTSPHATVGRFTASFGPFQSPMSLPTRIATEDMSQAATLHVTLTRLARCDGTDAPLQ